MDTAESRTFEEAEQNFANQLKEQCDDGGCEKNPEETAEIFHKLGMLYMKRKDYKVSLIQSSALLAAAIVRKPNDNDAIKLDLEKLWNIALTEAKARNSSHDLYSISSLVREEVDVMRNKAEITLNNLHMISEDLNADIQQMEKQKISDIQNLQEQITKKYISIMNNLSGYCISVLGDPPSKCRFTLAGMGSIAKKEVTPFSDFENIIVLEEGIQDKDDYESILEYFRWFAVIFQIVLISLGETILPSVAIPSLNDFYSPEGSWFYDNFTPRGISFDGLMPYACKTPLGRQKPTADKPWTIELIKPVKQMLNYLDLKVDLKNGYHLADILTKTCFVTGDRKIYDEFKSGVNKVLEYQRNNSEEFFLSLAKQVEGDKQSFGIHESIRYLFGETKLNVKRVVYRSLTIFISALGKYYGVSGSSCFGIIREIRHKGLISEDFAHKLNYAISIACEVRLKVYMQEQKQQDWVSSISRHNSPTMGIVEAVGEKSSLDFCAITSSLQDSLPSFKANGLDDKIQEVVSSFFLDDFSTCFALGMYERCVAMSHKVLREIISLEDKIDIGVVLSIIGLCHFHVKGVLDGSKDFESYLREFANIKDGSETQAKCCLRITKKCLTVNGKITLKFFKSILLSILPSLRQDRQNKTIFSYLPAGVISDCSSILKDELMTKIPNSRLQTTSSNMFKVDIESLHNLPPPYLYIDVLEDALQNLKRKLKSELENSSSCTLSSLASSSSSSTSSSSSSPSSPSLPSSSLPTSLTIVQIEDRKYIDKASSLRSYGNYLFNNELYEEALNYFQCELEFLSNLDDKDRDVTKCKINIGKCLYKRFDYEKAFKHFQLLLSQYVEESVNQDCIFYIGRCLFKLKRYEKAVHYLSLQKNYQM